LDNAYVPWDTFDSDWYFQHNYHVLRRDDAQVIDIVADFFQRNQVPGRLRPRAIDIGPGTNLYPALSMMPFAAELHLVERAASNRRWLESEIVHPRPSWWRFWDRMKAGRCSYAPIEDPFDLLGHRVTVAGGNIFDLRAGTYDMGTMFIVAESITSSRSEFVRATRSFVNSLVPRAPFAAAFMRNSSGYRVGLQTFPACSVEEEEVDMALKRIATDVRIRTVDGAGLREGYSGIIVVTGRKRAA
jgi:hypothetical protein